MGRMKLKALLALIMTLVMVLAMVPVEALSNTLEDPDLQYNTDGASDTISNESNLPDNNVEEPVINVEEAKAECEVDINSLGLLNPPKDETVKSSDEQTIWTFLNGKLGNAYGTAGVMGNLYAESALLSNNLENSKEPLLGFTDATYTAAVDNGTYTNFVNDAAGYGLAQWTPSDRKQKLLNAARTNGVSISNLNMQLNYLWSELSSSSYSSLLSTLRNAGSVETASTAFLKIFERPSDTGTSVQAIRARYGQVYYDRYASANSLTPTYTPSSYYQNSKYYSQLCAVSLTGTQRTDIINVALSQVGYHEGNNDAGMSGLTSGSNNYTEYNYWYWNGSHNGGSNYPWCAVFVSWCARQAQIPTNIIKNSAGAGCSSSYFNLTYYSGSNYTPQPGDLFFTSGWTHVGIVYYVDGDGFYTIEGNCSDKVLVQRRSGLSNYYFGVPNYNGSTEPSITLSGNYTYPTTISQGSSFYLTGTIYSNYTLEWAYVAVLDGSGNAVLSKGINPNSTTVNIATQIDNYIKFGTLGVGTYTYHIEATDVTGYFKVLHSSTFNVVSSGSSGNSTDPTQYSIPTGYLNVGNSGEGVMWLQACLNQLGYSCTVDGQFGSGTAAALKQFQSAYGLTVDGGMGPEVRTKMIELLTCPIPTISSAVSGYSSVVTLSYSAGTFTSGSTIYYTVDGASPSQGSYQYASPFSVTTSCTVNAIVCKSCRYSSPAASAYVSVPDGIPTIPVVAASVSNTSPLVTVSWTSDNYNTTSFDLYAYEGNSSDFMEVYYTIPVNQHTKSILLNPGQYRFRVAAVNTGISPYTYIFSDFTGLLTVPDYIFTVTFKDWDGSVLNTQSVSYGQSASAPADPARTGYTFTGWDNSFDEVTEDRVITAQYSVNSYTVTFYLDGELYSEQSFEYGAAITFPEVDAQGYTFSGWMLADGSPLPATMPANDLQVFGMLSRDYITVTYTGAYNAVVNVPYGGNAELPVLDAEGVHYTFTVDGEPWDGINLTSDVTVTVGMDINVYTVKFIDPVDDLVISIQQINHGMNASAPSAPSHYGYTFEGWDKPFVNVKSDLNVYAVYTPVCFNVIFMDGCDNLIEVQSVPYLSAATAPSDPVREGYTFTGWDADFSRVEHDMVVNATWSRNYYTVTFTGVYTGTVIVEHGHDCELPVYNSTTIHYTFTVDGEPWDGKNIICDVFVTVGVAVNGNYTVTFVDWDGTVINEQVVPYGYAAEAPADPTRPGYTFIGWDKDFSYITNDLCVTALYAENASPIVGSGDINGDGEVTMADVSALVAYLMNSGSISDEGYLNADANGDGEVNILDATAIYAAAFGA